MYKDYTLENEERLSPYAQKSINTRGRAIPVEPCEIRTEYQRDRDRIIHCKSFRRLKHKTQVFLAPAGDHYRTRLTHTLEVSQIARTISRALRLNEDLTEAIALGHDLGHTPFGHAGERVLRHIRSDKHFEHNEQSKRLVEYLENGVGLNLTFEVIDGILNHKKGLRPMTLEGAVVNLSDRIAYINHDIDDAVRAKVITLDDIPERCKQLGESHGKRINSMIVDVVEHSYGKPEIGMSLNVNELTDELRAYLFDKVYIDSAAKTEEQKADKLLEILFNYYMENPSELPEDVQSGIARWGKEDSVTDYISGMTDTFAISCFSELFIPRGWREY